MSDAKQWTGGVYNVKKCPNILHGQESRRGNVTCAAHLFVGFEDVSIHSASEKIIIAPLTFVFACIYLMPSPAARKLQYALERVASTHQLAREINQRVHTKYDSTNPAHERKLMLVCIVTR
jgi:hypothetical protein